MSYYIWLCHEQNQRLIGFRAAHSEMPEADIRQAFFGQRYEAHISASIVQGISANSDPNPID